MPAVKAKTGAQKWVIHLVKKSAALVRDKSVGEKDIAEMLVKSRTWSRAMMTMMAPRRASTDWMRGEPEVSSIGRIGTLYAVADSAGRQRSVQSELARRTSEGPDTT